MSGGFPLCAYAQVQWFTANLGDAVEDVDNWAWRRGWRQDMKRRLVAKMDLQSGMENQLGLDRVRDGWTDVDAVGVGEWSQ